MPSGKADKTRLINMDTVIHIYKIMKLEPNKTFVAKDFGYTRLWLIRDKYMNLLINLNLVEEVSARYATNNGAFRYVRGFRIKKDS